MRWRRNLKSLSHKKGRVKSAEIFAHLPLRETFFGIIPLSVTVDSPFKSELRKVVEIAKSNIVLQLELLEGIYVQMTSGEQKETGMILILPWL